MGATEGLQARIRPALAGDMAAITAIYGHAVRNSVATYETVEPDVAEMASRYERIGKAGYPWLAASADGRVVGYAYAGPFRDRPAYRFLAEDSIYIDPAWHGRGIGSALLERLLAECGNAGLRQMVAVIGGGEQASVALHRRAGFAVAGTLHASGFKFGRWLDTVLMQRPLGPGGSTLPA